MLEPSRSSSGSASVDGDAVVADVVGEVVAVAVAGVVDVVAAVAGDGAVEHSGIDEPTFQDDCAESC